MNSEEARISEASGFVVPERIDLFMQRQRPATPYVIIDVSMISEQYCALRSLFPRAQIYYAVKANPSADVLDRIAALGAEFRSG